MVNGIKVTSTTIDKEKDAAIVVQKNYTADGDNADDGVH